MAADLYTKLDSDSRQIRLIELQPARSDVTIECKLTTVSLDQRPQFEALSYCWGPSLKGRSIRVNNSSMPVTDNLYNALHRLRNNGDTRKLWIDQLCINQEDNGEKSRQIPMMGAIYTQSSQTLLWLGDEPDETASDVPAYQLRVTSTRPCVWAHASDPSSVNDPGAFLPHFENNDRGQGCEKYEEDYVYHAFLLISKLAVSGSAREIPYLGQQPTSLDRNTLHALWFVMHRPWWGRIWTVQECLLPKKAVVMYGPVVAPFEMFFLAASRFSGLAASDPGYIAQLEQSQAQTMRHFGQSLTDLRVYYDQQHAGRKLNLASLLRQFRIRDATNGRDKVYGLLGLNIDWNGHEPLQPDCDLETVQVYQSTALALIQSSESLDIMMSNLDRTGNKMKEMNPVPTTADIPELPSLDDIDPTKPEAAIGRLEQFMDQLRKAPYYDDTPNNAELPSWAPDWSSQTNFEILPRYDQMQLYAATEGTRAQARLIGSSILALRGIEVDTIRWSSQVMAHNGDEDRLALFEDWMEFAKDASAYTSFPASDYGRTPQIDVARDALGIYASSLLSEQSMPQPVSPIEDAFWRTICGNTVMVHDPKEKNPRPSYKHASDSDYQLYLAWCHEINEASSSPGDLAVTGSYRENYGGATSNITRSIQPAIRAATTMRRLFITRKGFLGLGPPLAVGGEKVFLLHGGKAPFLLRIDKKRTIGGEEQKEYYQLVGDCYIHGIMDGEAMGWGCPESEVLLV
jgi:hypothetical protein